MQADSRPMALTPIWPAFIQGWLKADSSSSRVFPSLIFSPCIRSASDPFDRNYNKKHSSALGSCTHDDVHSSGKLKLQ